MLTPRGCSWDNVALTQTNGTPTWQDRPRPLLGDWHRWDSPARLVVFCSLRLLQPSFFCTDTCQILSFAFLSLIAPLAPILWLLLLPSILIKPPAEKHSGSRTKPPARIPAASHGSISRQLCTSNGFFGGDDGSRCPLAPPLPQQMGHGSSGRPAAWGHTALHSTGAAVAPKPRWEGDVDAGHACQPRSRCQGRAWAVAAGISNPSPLPKGGKNRPVVPQGCQGDIFLAAALSQPLSWQGLCGGSWGGLPLSPHRGAPAWGHPAAWDHQPWDAAGRVRVGARRRGGGYSGTLEEPCRDEKCQSFAGA